MCITDVIYATNRRAVSVGWIQTVSKLSKIGAQVLALLFQDLSGHSLPIASQGGGCEQDRFRTKSS